MMGLQKRVLNKDKNQPGLHDGAIAKVVGYVNAGDR